MRNIHNSNNEDVILLSICIPTYNRILKTAPLVKAILEYKGDDIEVVVVDNCSTDNTQSVLSDIQDNRFKYLRNKEAIDGMSNILKSLTHGVGRYVLLCLDKDHILPEKIPVFLEHLLELNIDVGQCSLNSSEYLKDISYNEGIDSILNIAYTSEHPSGLFVKNSILKQNPIIDGIVKKYKTFAFLPELLKAEAVVLGKAGRINMPFVYTETREECAKAISHTYKGSKIYFMPANIINTFNIYVEHLYLQPLSKGEKRIVADKIYRLLLFGSVTGYKNVMADKFICMHHGIMTKEIKKTELLGNIWRFNRNFFSFKFPESFLWKFRTAFVINAKIIIHTIIN